MTNQKLGALALLLGTLTSIALMMFHSNHAHITATQPVGTLVIDFSHGLALLMTPLFAIGSIALAEYLGMQRGVVRIALAYYLLGVIAVVGAAMISGLVTPRIAGMAHNATEMDRVTYAGALRLSVLINRALAQIHISFFSMAIVLFAWSWPKQLRFATVFRTWGILVGTMFLYWQWSGHFEIGIHNMLTLNLVQGSWVAVAAILMWRHKNLDLRFENHTASKNS